MARRAESGPRAVTLKDVAAHLGISFSTVSRALRSDHHVSSTLRAKILAAADELGYIPNSGARLLHRSSSSLIGLVIPDFENQLFAATARVLTDHCNKAGYELILAVSGDDPEVELKQVTAMRSARVAGIILGASGRTLPRTVELLADCAVVQLAARDRSLSVPTVAANDRQSIESSMRHLLQLGHRRIGYVGGPLGLGTAEQRFEGYGAALESAGISLDAKIVARGPLTTDFARTAVARFLQADNRPTAIVMSNSLQTEGAIEAVLDAGISVPGQLSLVGFGDPTWFKLWGPGITTVDAREVEIADTAASILMDQIANGRGEGSEPLRLVVNTRLILRGSTDVRPAD